MRIKIKRFICGIFGHCFGEIPTESYYNAETHEITITETCRKCGKQFSFTAHEKYFGL